MDALTFGLGLASWHYRYNCAASFPLEAVRQVACGQLLPHRRTVKRVQNSADLDCTYHFYYDASWRLLETRNGSEQVIQQHVWGQMYIDELVQVANNGDIIGDEEFDPLDPDHDPHYYWAQHDANFNVIGLVDGQGALVERYEYTPYGQRTVYFSPGPNDPTCHAATTISRRVMSSGTIQPWGANTIGHQGLLHDESLRTIQNRHRIWLPMAGYFAQPDPLGYSDGFNLYAGHHVMSTMLDPFGLSKGAAVGWVVTRVAGRLIKTKVLYSSKHAQRAFCLGKDVLLKGGRSAAKKLAKKVIGKNNLLEHQGHYLKEFDKWGRPHFQNDKLSGRHIFWGLLASAMTTAVDEANADDDCPKYQLVANSVYEQYTDPKSGLHALTVTHWVGEDSWFKCLDFINPMEVAALGADGLRWATNEVMSTEVGTSISVLKDGEPHVTFHLDTEGNLISLSPWSDGAPGELIDGEQFLQSLDNERHPLLNELAEYVRQQSPSVEDKDCECPE